METREYLGQYFAIGTCVQLPRLCNVILLLHATPHGNDITRKQRHQHDVINGCGAVGGWTLDGLYGAPSGCIGDVFEPTVVAEPVVAGLKSAANDFCDKKLMV